MKNWRLWPFVNVLLLLLTSAEVLPIHQSDESTKAIQDKQLLDVLGSMSDYNTFVFEMTLLPEGPTYKVKESHITRPNHINNEEIKHDIVHLISINNTELILHHFNSDGDVILEEKNGTCSIKGVEEIPRQFWGWLHEDTGHGMAILGPSRILRKIQSANEVFLEDVVVDGTVYEKWQFDVNNDINIQYFFSKIQHLTTDGSLPDMYNVNFIDTGETTFYRIMSAMAHVDPHDEALKSSACMKLTNDLTIPPKPMLPSYFSYSKEIIESLPIDGSIMQRQVSHNLQVEHNKDLGLSSFEMTTIDDVDSIPGRISKLKVIRDSISGTEYVINKETGTCTKSRLSEDFVNSPLNETFLLDEIYLDSNIFSAVLGDTFSFVGMTTNRGIKSSLWQSTSFDVPDPRTKGLHNYSKVVFDHYFIKSQDQRVSESKVDIPLSSDVLFYDLSDSQKVVRRLTSNIYNFEIQKMSSDKFLVHECSPEDEEDSSDLVMTYRTDTEKNSETKKFIEDKKLSDTFDPEHQFTDGDMVGVACAMILLGIIMTGTFLVTLVLTANKNYPRPSAISSPMSYVSLKATSGESNS